MFKSNFKLATIAAITSLGISSLSVITFSVSNLTLIEQDKVNPSVATLDKLAVALNCKQTDFFINEVINEPVVVSNDNKDIKGFTVSLINRLLQEGIITDKDEIPQEVIAAIVASLKLDLNNKKH